MPNDKPKLRGNRKSRSSPHDLGEFDVNTIEAIARQIVHRLAVGHADITGDDWGGIFAKAIEGEHRGSPLGLADVTWENCGWTVKTVGEKNPFAKTQVRLISGRNSPTYSFDITDPLADIQKTGDAVLKIWNGRINESLSEHGELRVVVLLRDMSNLRFALFEDEVVRFQPNNYRWELNSRKNLLGIDRTTGKRCFTWQKHGSQFTIHKNVPSSVVRFSLLRRPLMIEEQHIINLTKFDKTWVKIEARG